MSSYCFEVAKEVLERNGFPLFDLPLDIKDPMWEEIRIEYQLKLPQLITLKNYVYDRVRGLE